jgi:hypothetical protein
MMAAEIDAASTTGVKRTSIEKNHEAIKLAAARARKPPPNDERHRLPPNRPTAIAAANEGIPIISTTIQEFGSAKVTLLRVSTYALCKGVRSPKAHEAKLSPAANIATATDIDSDLKI